MFIDQIYDKVNNNFLSWQVISRLANLPPRGRVTEWYKLCLLRLHEEEYKEEDSRLNTGWYTNILTGFNYKRLRKDTFITRISNNKKQTIIFGE